MLYIGIDPGKTNGGMSVYNGSTGSWNLGKERPEAEWKELFSQWVGVPCIVGVEKQTIREEDRDSPAFYGIQRLIQQTERMIAMLRALDIPTVEVYPVS